ncbi:MAG TPA: 3-oxoacyl-ACP reductase family protein [Desulfobacteraceae bacterium]|nr:3-oxoacyl-ACP reductase family protein [Desulfobacteraceae bacterium]HPJ66816.1 3-oxoacyl-ACP reductase family protein [Desulfobacteraceae bacterium]HPQ27026.1 3-oxoacyl-ACP reductase family protein [Desulfobacteraceae bacterium]
MDTAFSINDKVAIVTGGSSGIGFEICRKFSQEKAHVVIADIIEERSVQACEMIKNECGNAIAIKTDVTSKESVDKLIERTLGEYSRVDILVNCAGINIRKPYIEYSEKEWDLILSVNLKGVFLVSQAVGRIMISQRKGKVINISSVLEKIGQEARGPYAASKGGVAQLTKVLALEWAPYNINVNCIAPGFIKTPLIASVIEQDKSFEEFINQNIPLRRLGVPEDVAFAALYLASEASSYVTGQSFFIDGGWTTR